MGILTVSLLIVQLLAVANLRAQTDTTLRPDPTVCRSTIGTIWAAAKMYYTDKGDWPKSVNDLIQESHTVAKIDLKYRSHKPKSVDDLVREKYLTIAPEILDKWQFGILGIAEGPPLAIQANLAEALPYETDNFCTVSYNIVSGWWSGYGIPHYGHERLMPDEQADLAAPAISAIHAITAASEVYYQDKGIWPETPQAISDEQYVYLDNSTQLQWTFAIIGEPPEIVVAMSTDSMPDGAGRAIFYDASQRSWKGYGLSKLNRQGDSYEFYKTIYFEPVHRQ